jgi:hypothetical protein
LRGNRVNVQSTELYNKVSEKLNNDKRNFLKELSVDNSNFLVQKLLPRIFFSYQ